MNNFIFHNPTRLIFGRGQLAQLRLELADPGKRVLLVYGGGSIKRSGLYDDITSILREAGAKLHELPGVEPNPRLSTVRKGVEICRREQVDFILAVGGGSVIDCTKAIAVGARYEGDVWEVITGRGQATGALPLGAGLTVAGTGSEMNAGAGSTNRGTKGTVGWVGVPPYTFPTFSILDPVYTFTVPQDQTVYGAVDMMSHVLEQYFHTAPNTPLQDRWMEGLLRTVMETAPKALANPEDYEARETLLFCGTMALNQVLRMGTGGDWSTHWMEHVVSGFYNIPHGGGLAILTPNWMKYCLDANPGRFAQLAVRVIGVDPAGRSDSEIGLEGIERLQRFWTGIGAPSRLADYGIGDDQVAAMAAKATEHGDIGVFRTLTKEDVAAIFRMSL